MAGARKRGRKWYALYKDEHGRDAEKVLPESVRTLTAARKLAGELAERAFRIREGLEVGPVRITVAEAVARYLDAVKTHRSFYALEARFRLHIVPTLGSKLLHQVLPVDIDALLDAKRAELGGTSRKHLQVHLGAFYRWCSRKAGLLPKGHNPVAETKPIARPEPNPKTLAVEVVERVATHASSELFADLIRMAICTGARKGELLGARWEDISVRQVEGAEVRVWLVRRSYQHETTKGGKSRPVPLPPELWPMLDRRRALGGEWVFTRPEGGPYNRDLDVARSFKAALRAAGLVAGYVHKCRRKGCGYQEERKTATPGKCPKCAFALWPKRLPLDMSFKDLRSSYVTHVTERTGDIRAAQLLAGHQDQRTTHRHYAAARDAHLSQVVGKAFGGGAASPLPVPPSEHVPKGANG